jgi:amino acid permease
MNIVAFAVNVVIAVNVVAFVVNVVNDVVTFCWLPQINGIRYTRMILMLHASHIYIKKSARINGSF